MRKVFKKVMGTVLATTLCLSVVPGQRAEAQIAYVPENSSGQDVEMTNAQLLEAYMGEWDETYYEFSVSEEKIVIRGRGAEEGEYREIEWDYVDEEVIMEHVPMTENEYFMQMELGVQPSGEAKALHFLNEESDWYLYKGYHIGNGTTVVYVDERDKVTDEVQNKYVMCTKYIDEEEYTVKEALELAKEVVPGETEEPKPEEPVIEMSGTEEPTVEEPKEEETKEEVSKTEVSVTASGRELYEGEGVYIVQRGDCLWSIAKKLFGNGARYKELFTRNGDIIKKAELIHTGQEIIYNAK